MPISLKVPGDIDIGRVVLWSFLPWSASKLLEQHHTGGNVLHDLAHAVFILNKISYSTKPTYGIFAFFYDRFILAVVHCIFIPALDGKKETLN